jgi:glycerophosphoryl diester phosphodiesterase
MKKNGLIILFYLVFSSVLFAQTRVIAHRGFWKTKGSAQNSIAALENAAQAGVYGAEFDVWITSDGVPVINHDKDINGVVIETSSYEKVKQEKLPNGEMISTLKEYLKEGARYPDLKLVLELKDHSKNENDKRAVEAVMKLVRKSRAYRRGQVEFISFNYEMCKEFAREFPDVPVSYLSGDKSPETLHKDGIDGIDYHKAIVGVRKDWIRKAHELGMTVNVWTVNDDSLIVKMGQLGVDFITTDEPLKAKALLEKE